MKKLAFIIIGIIYCLGTFGQSKISLNDAAKLELPIGVQKISREDALSFANKKFNNDNVIAGSITNRNATHIYEVDGVLVSLFVFDQNSKVSPNHLSDVKRGLDGMNVELHWLKGAVDYYKSTLKKVNNNSVLIVYDIGGKVGYYHFYCYNANNTKQINGILEFDKADTSKATAMLDSLLNSIRFKD